MQVVISKANILQHTAPAVLTVTKFGTLCVPGPVPSLWPESLLDAIHGHLPLPPACLLPDRLLACWFFEF